MKENLKIIFSLKSAKAWVALVVTYIAVYIVDHPDFLDTLPVFSDDAALSGLVTAASVWVVSNRG